MSHHYSPSEVAQMQEANLDAMDWEDLEALHPDRMLPWEATFEEDGRMRRQKPRNKSEWR